MQEQEALHWSAKNPMIIKDLEDPEKHLKPNNLICSSEANIDIFEWLSSSHGRADSKSD